MRERTINKLIDSKYSSPKKTKIIVFEKKINSNIIKIDINIKKMFPLSNILLNCENLFLE